MGKTRQTGNIVSDGLVSVDIANDQFKVGSGVTIYGSSGIISATSLYVGGTQVTGAASGISSVADDTTPRLGGDLDLNSNDITGTGNFNVTGVITATSYDGQVKLSLEESDTTNYLTFANDSQGYQTLKSNTGLAFNASNGTLTAAYFTGNGSNLTNVDATTLDSIDSGSFLRSDQLDYVTSGGIAFNDNIRLYLGTGQGNDAELFYNGTNSYFNVATGDLYITTRGGEYAGDDIIIESADDFEVRLNAGTNIGAGTTAIYATGGGSVALTHNGSTKFETTNTGIDVTGIVTATSVSVGSTTNIIRKVTDVNSWVAADADTSFSVTSQQNTPTGLYFKSDGTKMFVVGTQSPRDVEEYALSSAWDITTASHTTAHSINSQDNSPQGLYFSPNGENMFVAGNQSNSILHYTLDTGWDLSSTINYEGNFSVSSQATLPTGVTFGDSGTKMYVVGRTNDSIHQYNLSSAYTITSGVTHAHTLDIGQSSSIIGTPNGFANPHGISISSDGTKIWIIGVAEDIIAQFNLGTAYDLSTATYNGDFTNIFWASVTSYDLYIDESAEKGFVLFAGTDDSVREIDITNSGLSIEANPTARSANINLNNNVQVKGRTWFEDAIVVNGSQTSYFQHNVQVQGQLTCRSVIDLADGSEDRIQFGASDDAKIYYDGTDNYFDLQFSTADNNGFRILNSSDSELFRVAKDGKVGINSTSPTADLDVNGDVNVSGALTATSFVKATNSSGFLKADGTEDTSTYLTSYTETQTLDNVVGLGSTTTQTISVGNLNVTGTGNTSTITGATNLVLDPAAVGDNTGKVVILGNLQVDGTTTEINSTTLTVDDKSIVLASGAADSAAANGAGIEIDGASATFQYAHTGTKWVANKSIEATSFIKNGGASTEFLKADGSVDSSTYITSADGGNAATLDGVDSTSFLRSDAADTKTSGNLTFNDSIQANFGTNSDLRISHDGTDNHIMSADKDLNIELSPDGATPKIYIRPTTSHQGITLGGGSGNPVELYHTNAKKFETTGSGAIVTGVLTATSFSGSGSSLTGLTGASAATYGSATATPVIVVDSDGRITGISTVATSGSGGGGGTPGGSDGQIQYNNSGSFGGAAQLYYDDANNRLGINSSTPAYSLDLGESASTIRLVSENGGTAIRIGAGGQNDFTLLRVDGMGVNHDGESDSAAYGFTLKYLGSGSGNNNSLQILSDNQNAGTQVQAFTMLQDGKIGIANTTPSTELEVGGTITATNYTGKIYIDESADDDAEHNLVFIDAAYSSGDQGNSHLDLEIDSGAITFNPSTNTLTVPNIAGIATGATRVYIDESADDDAEHNLVFIDAAYSSGNQGNAHLDLEIDSGGITFNPSTNTLTVPNIVASLTGVASSATKVYVDESEDDDANYHVMFSDVTPGGGNEYRTLQVDSGGITFNPFSNHLKITSDSGAVAIGTNRNTNIDASLEIDHGELVGTAYTNSMLTDYNGNIRITANEPTIEIIGSDGGNHAASIYMRNLNEGYAFINNPTTEELEIKSFTASANDFHATSANGSNLSSLNKILRIGKDGTIGISTGSILAFDGPTTTGAFYHASNADTTLLRVTSNSSTANLSGDYGFTLKYLGSGSGNNNALQILSDNQNAGTQVQAFTMLQDGKIGISSSIPTSTLDVGGTITATSFVKSSNSGGFLKADGTEDTNTYLTTAASEAFKTIAVSGQSDVVADSATDTLTLVAGSNMTITTNASGDSITFTSSGGGGSGSIGIQSGGVLVGTATTINFGSGATITNNVASVSVGSTTRFVGARLYHNNYTLTGTNAWREVVSWDGTAIDTNSFVDASDGFTIPAGVSKIRITIGVRPSTSGANNQWRINKNGSALEVNDGGIFIEAESQTGYNNGSSTGTSAVLSVSQGDTFDLRYYNSSTTPTWDIFFELEVIEGDILGTYFSANNIVDDTSPQLGGDLQTNSNDIKFADSDRAIFGSGSLDSSISHDGTNTNFFNYVGDLVIGTRGGEWAGDDVIIESADDFEVKLNTGTNTGSGTTAIYATGGGSVKLNHNGSTKFETTNIGIAVSGIVTAISGIVTYYGDGSNLTGISTYSDGSVDSHLNQSNPTSGYVLSWNGSDYAWVAQSGGGGGGVGYFTTTTNGVNYTGIGTTSAVGIGTIIEIIPYDTQNSGTLSFEASAGQLFSITNNLSSGSIFSVNDISGIPSIDVDADGTVLVAPYSTTEKVGVGTTNPSYKMDVVGDINFTGTLYQDGSVFNPGVTPSGGEGAVQFNSSSNLSGISTLLSVGSTTFSVGIGTIIDIKPYDTQNSGTLSFEASAGQLFSITNNLTSGSIFSVNDVSGIPSIDVNADGTVLVAPYSTTEKVGIGTTNPTHKLHVVGDVEITGTLTNNGSAVGGGSGVSDGDKGDITVSNSGATWAIDSDAVTYAKIQNVTATNRILGRDSAGAGVIEEITPANVRTMLNVADGANAYSHPNHTGDVTSTGDGATVIAGSAVTTTKIADDAVTYAKIQNVATANRVLGSTSADGVVSELQIATDMVSDDAVTYAKIQNVTATNRILGRDSSGAGVIEEITPANVRTMLNVADGATAYANTNVDSHLNTSSASNNEVLSWNGSDYAWVAQSGGGGGGTGVASTITVADESSDTTCFPIFSTAATGDINPKTGSNLTFNSSDGTLTATSFVGVAQSATKVYVDESEDDDVYYNLIFTDENPDAGDKYHGLQVDDGGIRFNPGSNSLAVQNLVGIAQSATKVYVDESEDDDVYYNVIFTDENPDAGNKYHGLQVDDNGLGFNPGANTLYVANVRISNSISNVTNSNTKFGFIGTTGFYVETNDIERLSVLENGNVGIGSTIPTTVLDVGGTITATSFVKSGGTSSQYLMADGSTSTSGGGGGGGGVSQAKATAISMVFG